MKDHLAAASASESSHFFLCRWKCTVASLVHLKCCSVSKSGQPTNDALARPCQMNKAIVYIEEMDSVADVTFPAVPQVVSLLMYDDTAKSKDKPHPANGYPVVCVTVSCFFPHCP